MFCFHVAHISFASSWYLFCLSVIVLARLCVFGTAMSIKRVFFVFLLLNVISGRLKGIVLSVSMLRLLFSNFLLPNICTYPYELLLFTLIFSSKICHFTSVYVSFLIVFAHINVSGKMLPAVLPATTFRFFVGSSALKFVIWCQAADASFRI